MKGEKVFGPYSGIVDEVHDGDTVNVRLDVGFDLTVYARVRVFGIQAPELTTSEGKASLDFARLLLPIGSAVRVTSHGWDKYGGRIDGSIECSQTGIKDFANSMLIAGHAVPWDGKGNKPS